MADIVGVHGIFMNRSSRLEMHDTWLAAIATGMDDRRSARAGDVKFECAFFGDLYRSKGATAAPLAVTDLAPGFEQELLLAMDEDLVGKEEASATKGATVMRLQRALARLQEREFLEGASSAVLSFVRQANRYFTDQAFRRNVLAEFAQAIGTEAPVVVAHSLGTIVAYDWLRAHPGTPKITLVTMGSPLGFREVRRLLGALDEPLAWPSPVARWVNVAGENDPVAMVKELDGVVEGFIDDRIAVTGWKTCHSATEYLANPHVSKVLVETLG
ncbi:MAG: hypothetical protein WA966_11310 [Ornithinimicrobium sp.]